MGCKIGWNTSIVARRPLKIAICNLYRKTTSASFCRPRRAGPYRLASRCFSWVCPCWCNTVSTQFFTRSNFHKSSRMGLYRSYSAWYFCWSEANSCRHALAGILSAGERCFSNFLRVMWNIFRSRLCSASNFSRLPFHLIPFHSSYYFREKR